MPDLISPPADRKESPRDLFETAQDLFHEGAIRAAALLCRKLLAWWPDFTPPLHLLGVITFRDGETRQARNFFEKILQHEPENPVAWSNLGVVCRSLGDFAEARRSFERALALSPGYPDAWNNLGTVLEKEDGMGAVTCYRRSISLDPTFVVGINNLARCLSKQQLFPDAASWYRRSLEIDPDQPDTLYRLGEILEQGGDPDGAREMYRRSLLLQHDDAVLLRSVTLLPVVMSSSDEIEQTRERLWHDLMELERRGVRIEKPWERGRVFFYLSYHGADDRRFHEALARIYRRGAPILSWDAPHVGRPRDPDRRIRLGFVSRFFFNHTIAKLTIGVVEKIDRTRFEVFVILIDSGRRDSMTERFAQAADHFVTVSGEIPAMRERIGALELDILYFTDIGMEPCSYFLAFARLATVQCVTWGHPATTGIDTVDYFISHQECETTQSLQSYSEKLFCLSSESACACYAYPHLPVSGKSREELGVKCSGTLYLSPQPPFKMHPDFDRILTRILERDQTGTVVFLRGVAPETEKILLRRFQRSMGVGVSRVMFLDPLPFPDYLALLSQADVVLDTPHFSGGSSTVEALAVGAVVVTLPSPYLKGRLSYAWYRRIGVHDPIAHSADEYVDIAVRLGMDREYRDRVRGRIRAGVDRLFDDYRMVRELEQFFEKVVNGEPVS